MSWDNLIGEVNMAKAKACIYGNIHLIQQYPNEKQLLKMSINSRDNQVKKIKAVAVQTKANFLISYQSKSSKKAKKEKIQKQQQKK